MKIYALFFVVFASFYPFLGLAQDASRQTPREIIVNEIMQVPLPTILQTEEPVPLPPATPRPDLTPVPPLVENIIEEFTPENSGVVKVIIDNGGENISEVKTIVPLGEAISEPITIILPEEVLPESSQIPTPQIAAFYLTTEEYLAMRGPEKAPQLVLTYDVSSQKKDMLLPVKTQMQIILGNDYGAMKTISANGIEITKIYDFRFNRLLTAISKQGDVNFDNISLYAPIYRNITTVRRATQNGKLKTITLGGGKKLEAFWVESAMGWAVEPSNIKLNIKEKKSTLTIIKDKKTIFAAKFSKDDYANDNFKQVLRRLATHEWPVHPKVLDIFANFTSPPESFKILSYNPGALKGETQTWTLVSRQENEALFPLPSTALSIAQRQPISPLVFIIGEAVRGRAFGGPQTAQELESDFEAADKQSDGMALWLIGQRYNSYTGKCEQNTQTWLCALLNSFEEGYSSKEREAPRDPKLVKFIQAIRLAKQGKERVKVLTVLQPFLNEPDVPAIILQTAGLIRAKIKPSDILTPMISALDAQTLLQSALAKDPYDPNTYLSLAQINAANEAYEASWDFYDALRADAISLGVLDIKIDKVEDKLRRTAPMYFLEN